MKQGLLSLVILWVVWSLPAQTPFFEEQFIGGEIPTGWGNADISGNDAGQLVVWQGCQDPKTCPPSNYYFFRKNFGRDFFDAPSAENGYAYAHAFPAGLNTLSTPFLTQLTSTPIDCSTQSEVFLRFTAHISTLATTAFTGARVQVSTDSLDWTSFSLYPNLELAGDTLLTTNPVTHYIDISTVAANAPNVYLRWEWTGTKDFVWCIDDIQLFNSNPYYEKAVWGHLPEQGDFAGGLNGWSVNNELNPSLDFGWIWSEESYFGNAALAPDGFYLGSPSALNGAMIMNADAYSTENGTMPPPNPWPCYISELISPTIDLSGIDKRLALKFAQVASLNSGVEGYDYITSISYSIDDGNSWSQPFNANPGLYVNSEYRPIVRYFPLPDEILGQADVRIKFTFAGKFFAWAIDDVVLYEREPNDLELKRNFFAVAPTLMTPSFLVDSLHFLVDVENVGQDTQYNVQARVEIREKASQDLVFQDSSQLGNLAPNGLVENIIFTNAYLPPPVPATYQVRYFHQAEEPDQFPLNDTVIWDFVITDSTLAKELGPTNAFAPGGDEQSYSYGNAYYINDFPGAYACSVTFGIGDPNIINGKVLTTLLFRWTDGDVNGDLVANANEIELVGLNEYKVNNDSIDRRALVTIPVQENNAPVKLDPNTYYFIVVRFSTVLSSEDYFMEISEQFDLQATYFLYDSLDKPRYMTMFDYGNEDEFTIIGLGNSGFDQVPVARLHLCLEVGDQERFAWNPRVAISPNPANEHILVQTVLEETTKDLQISLINVEGKLLRRYSMKNGQQFEVRIPVADLPAGPYYIQLKKRA